MNHLIDIILQTLGTVLFIILIIFGIIRFPKLKLQTNIITILGILLSLICVYYWMETGLKLKSSEKFFIKRKEAKYSNLTDKEIRVKLSQIKQDEKNTRKQMTLYGIGFLTITGATLIYNLKEK